MTPGVLVVLVLVLGELVLVRVPVLVVRRKRRICLGRLGRLGRA